MTNKGVIIALLISLVFNLISAQQKVIYNGKIFKTAEVLESQIGDSGETFSFYISEIDTGPNGNWAKRLDKLRSQGKEPHPDDIPKPLSLHLSIDFKKAFKFPITPEDSVFVNFSYAKEGVLEGKFNIEKMDKMKLSISNKDFDGLKNDKISVEEETRKISKLLQEGKISPDEAMKKIDALTKPMMDKLDNSAFMNQKTTEFKDNRPTYSMLFGDILNKTEGTPYEGNLHIIEFNTKRLIACFKGIHYVECTDVAKANNATKPCEKVETGLYPEHKVLRIEDISIIINAEFLNFYDNR